MSIGVTIAFTDKSHTELYQAEIDLPATKAQLDKELSVPEITGEITGTAIYLISPGRDYAGIEGYVTDRTNVNELNYLAAKMEALNDDDLNKLSAVLESGRHFGYKGAGCGELADMINIIDNLDCFTFHYDFDAKSYGEYLLADPNNLVEKLKRELKCSQVLTDAEYADALAFMQQSIDAEQYGMSMSLRNDGEFLSSGYLIEHSGFKSTYYGALDIPVEFCMFEPSGVGSITIVGTEPTPLGKQYKQDAEEKESVLEKSSVTGLRNGRTAKRSRNKKSTTEAALIYDIDTNIPLKNNKQPRRRKADILL